MDSSTPQAIDEDAHATPDIEHPPFRDCVERSPHSDAELVDRFAVSGFTSPEFHAWFKDIFDTVAVWLDGWVRSEAVYVKLASYRRRPIKLDPSTEERHALRVRHTEREDLVADAVNAAGEDFVDKVLRAGKWDPKGGASVRSYFMRAVLFEFATVFRKWQRRRANEAQRFDKLVQQYNPFARDDLVGQFESDKQLERILHSAQTDEDRSIMVYLLEGRSERQIAEILGLRSTKRVRTIKSHMRKAYVEFEGGHDA